MRNGKEIVGTAMQKADRALYELSQHLTNIQECLNHCCWLSARYDDLSAQIRKVRADYVELKSENHQLKLTVQKLSEALADTSKSVSELKYSGDIE